jgi:hypothetical protein
MERLLVQVERRASHLDPSALYRLGETLHALADRVTIGHFPDRTGSRHRQKMR